MTSAIAIADDGVWVDAIASAARARLRTNTSLTTRHTVKPPREAGDGAKRLVILAFCLLEQSRCPEGVAVQGERFWRMGTDLYQLLGFLSRLERPAIVIAVHPKCRIDRLGADVGRVDIQT